VIAEPVLGRRDTAARRLRWTGWCTLLAEAWRDRGASPPDAMPGGAMSGVLHGDLPRWRAMAEALGDAHPLAVWRDAAAASDIAGVTLATGGLHVAGAGWLVPADLIARRLATVRAAGGRVKPAAAPGADAGDWLQRQADAAGADIIIDATGHGIAGAGGGLRIEAARGQVALIDATPATRGLRVVAGGRAACLPPDAAGRHLVASTYDHHDEDAGIRPGDHARILELLADGQPELAAALGPRPAAGAWAGIRRTTPDRVPYVGRVDGARPTFVSLAHGSRGVVGGALAGELIAAAIGGEPAPAFADDVATWSPQRFAPRT
jgi:tRNA 5-methylaminomethyl-2-thiouridine biosynthesis bifunctional protein